MFDQRVPEFYHNGEDFQYKILTQPAGVHRPPPDGSTCLKRVARIPADRFSYKLTVSEIEGLEVFVQAVNMEGKSTSRLQPIEIPGRSTGKHVHSDVQVPRAGDLC